MWWFLNNNFKIAVANYRQKLRFYEMSNNDAWVRDCGPSFVINDHGEIRGVDWTFNAWGISRWIIFPLGPRRFGCTKKFVKLSM